MQQTQKLHVISFIDIIIIDELLEATSSSGSSLKGQTEDTREPTQGKSSESKIVIFSLANQKVWLRTTEAKEKGGG